MIKTEGTFLYLKQTVKKTVNPTLLLHLQLSIK